MYNEYSDISGNSLTEFTAEDFAALQNYYIEKVIRHQHKSVLSSHVKISEMGEESNPVGLSTPLVAGDVHTWQDHVDLPHSNINISSGRLLARGWTVPIRTRFVIATPIMDTTSNLPFPTYNMSNITINKSLVSADYLESVPPNRHNHSTYTNYRHYLYMLPNNGVSQVHPSHKPILANTGSLTFAYTPLFVSPSNTSLLRELKKSTDSPNFRSLTYIPDYAEEKIWSLTEDSTCWLAGYKPIVNNNHRDISLFFNDMYNEFGQLLSMLNYEELYREYIFRLEKAPGNLTRLSTNEISDITRLMEAKKIDILDAPEHSGIIYDSINKRYSPFYMGEYNFSVDKMSDRLMDNLLSSCMDKKGKNVTFYEKGLTSFSNANGEPKYNHSLNIPSYFDNGTRQCLVLTGELGASRRSFKQLHKGRVMFVYQVVDGYFTIPYEIHSYSDIPSQSTSQETLIGIKSKRRVVDVTQMASSDNLCKE